jgi:hypothetical protein
VAFSTITERPGSLSAVGLAKEVTFGSPVTPTTFQPDTDCSIEPDPGWFSPGVMQGVRDKQIYNMYGEAKYTGNIDGPLFPTNGIPLLVYAIGTDAVTGTVAPYTHTVSQANTLSSITVEKNIGGFQSLQFAGCKVGKLTMKCPTGDQAVTMTADVTGRAVAVLDTPTAVSITNEIPFVFAEGALTAFGNSRAEATNIQIEIDNGLKSTYTFSQQHGPNFITPVTLTVNGSFDVVWDSLDDSTYGDFTTMETGVLGSLNFTLTHPGMGGNSVSITCPQIVLSKYKNDLKLADVVMTTLNFEASRPLTGGSQFTVKAVVTNGQSAAY